jgi:hypothetical protein
MATLDEAVGRRAATQHGLISRVQAMELGLSKGAIKHRLASGRWQLVAPATYLIAGAPLTWRGQVHAACLSTSGVASHRSAAVLLDIADFHGGRPEVTMPRGVHLARLDAKVHESTDLDRATILTMDGIPVTAPDRVAVDLGGVVSFERYRRAVEDLIGRRMLSWPEAAQALTIHARRGRRGVGALRALLEDHCGEVVPESILERMYLALGRHRGLPEPVAQLEIRDARGFIARVDFAYPQARVVIELDGRRFHVRSDAFEADATKRNRLRLAGWTVLVFTWDRLTSEPDAVVAEVRAALRLAA